MLLNEYMPVRVWHNDEMLFPKTYSLVQYSSRPPILKFTKNRVAIKTQNYMLPVRYEGFVFYTKDIVTATRNDKPIIGTIGYNYKACAYVIETPTGSYYLSSCKNVKLRGNILQHPQLLETLIDPDNDSEAIKTIEQLKSAPPSSDEPFNEKDVVIYTDGACIRNPGPGGAAYIIKSGNRVKKDAIKVGDQVTNNQCEMLAAIKAIQALPVKNCSVVLYSDSKYLLDGFNRGDIERWKNNGWKTTNGTPVKNKEYWVKLDELNSLHNINWVWVKGHEGNPYNEECDRMARLTAEGKVVSTL